MTLLETGSRTAALRLILAHGAGAPMTSPFMETIAALLAERDIAVTRFEFDYMAARHAGGKRRPPPRAETLTGDYASLVRRIAAPASGRKVLIGGKSMGGRVASLIAGALHAERLVTGLVCIGYPFHPPAKPEQLRTAHLADLSCPTLIIQGERDRLGSRDEVENLSLSKQICFVWMPDGDHDLVPRHRSGHTRAGNMALAVDAVVAFANAVVEA